jgi:serine/threonine-protein kinase
MRILGRYETWGRLSHGGMSEVWLARHEALAMPVVVKTVRPEFAMAAPESERRLVSTARLVARLSSPSVVRVIDAGIAVLDAEQGPTPCVVEEYVDGLDLAELDRRRCEAMGRALPLWAVADFVAQAAAGLHAAHQGGVIHRDVKPANLFADARGIVKVGDFGVAIAAHGQSDERPAGTPRFMAPEQLSGEACDRRSDVFSLGATAFALRYGRPPWADTGELLGTTPPRFPPARTAQEAYFQHVVEQAMARRPDARHPTARAFELAMRTLAEGARPTLRCVRTRPGRFAIRATELVLEEGDLADVECDAIVNSAYHDMTMRSGVGDALRRKGGDGIEEEAMAGGQRALGDCIATGAGQLACRQVLHAVGAWNEISCVARATWRALWLAEAAGHRRLAMPAIGTGKGRVSLAACADTLGSVLRMHLALGGSRLTEVKIVLADRAALRTFEEVIEGLLLGEQPVSEDETFCTATGWEDATWFASGQRAIERPM